MAVGDIEEFSDTPQPVTLANNSTDIEVKTPEPKKNIAESSITNQIEK
ncbi:647_t:CDS:1, partial [Paraglomus brasilianum]